MEWSILTPASGYGDERQISQPHLRPGLLALNPIVIGAGKCDSFLALMVELKQLNFLSFLLSKYSHTGTYILDFLVNVFLLCLPNLCVWVFLSGSMWVSAPHSYLLLQEARKRHRITGTGATYSPEPLC